MLAADLVAGAKQVFGNTSAIHPADQIFANPSRRQDLKNKTPEDFMKTIKAFKVFLHPDKKTIRLQTPEDIRLAFDHVTKVEGESKAMAAGFQSAEHQGRQVQ